MRGDFAEPVDAAVFHGGVGVEAFGDGSVDEGGFLFLEEGDEALLGGDEAVDLFELAIQKRHNRILLRTGRNWKLSILKGTLRQTIAGDSICFDTEVIPHARRREAVVE